MNRLKSKVTLFNTLSTLFLQFVLILNGFIVPKLILSAFGSEVNGLVASLNQFLQYIALVEGGITGVIAATLYKPLTEKDSRKLSAIISSAKKFYRSIGFIFIVYTFVLAAIYPHVVNTGFGFTYISLLTIILSIYLLIQYMLSITFKTLLTSDKKIYVVTLTQAFLRIAEIVLAYLAIKVYPSIHLLKFLTGALFIIQPIVFSRYVKKHYALDATVKPDKTLIKNRWDGFAINTAAFIHNSTDIAVLTLFTNLITVSVYSVYALVTTGVKKIVDALTSSLNPVIGHAYARRDFKELNQKLDLYEFIVFVLIFLFFGVAALLITPFVVLYTANLSDANYYQPLFGVLIVLSEALYLLKAPHLNLAYSANKFKEISKHAFIEAGLNIAISVALVPVLGLIGVAIGTIVAMIYRLIFHVYYTSKLIPGRSQWVFYRKLYLFILFCIPSVLLCLIIPAPEATIISWVWHAVLYSVIFSAFIFINSAIFFRRELKYFKNYLKRSK